MSKICKGTTSKTKGFGCSKPLPFSKNQNGIRTYKAKFGLGIDCNCYTNWLIGDTPEAKEEFDKLLINSKKDVEKKQKEERKKKKAKMKLDNESKGDLESKLQKPINKIARLLDKGHLCLSSGRPLGYNIGRYDGGHVISVKANSTIRFNLFNIYGQTVYDNQHLSGNEALYLIGIGETFGPGMIKFISKLKQTPPLHLAKHELRDKISIANSLVKWLQLQDRTFTKEERISIRTDMNNALGIYDQEYCEFKI